MSTHHLIWPISPSHPPSLSFLFSNMAFYYNECIKVKLCCHGSLGKSLLCPLTVLSLTCFSLYITRVSDVARVCLLRAPLSYSIHSNMRRCPFYLNLTDEINCRPRLSQYCHAKSIIIIILNNVSSVPVAEPSLVFVTTLFSLLLIWKSASQHVIA